VTEPSYFPVVHVSANYLRVASENVEGYSRLQGVELSDEVQQSFSDADALVIGQHNKSAHSIISCSHPNLNDRDERYWFIFVNRGIASSSRS
jgi:hypothetical protein